MSENKCAPMSRYAPQAPPPHPNAFYATVQAWDHLKTCLAASFGSSTVGLPVKVEIARGLVRNLNLKTLGGRVTSESPGTSLRDGSMYHDEILCVCVYLCLLWYVCGCVVNDSWSNLKKARK